MYHVSMFTNSNVTFFNLLHFRLVEVDGEEYVGVGEQQTGEHPAREQPRGTNLLTGAQRLLGHVASNWLLSHKHDCQTKVMFRLPVKCVNVL